MKLRNKHMGNCEIEGHWILSYDKTEWLDPTNGAVMPASKWEAVEANEAKRPD